jgi:hypothetical protein
MRKELVDLLTVLKAGDRGATRLRLSPLSDLAQDEVATLRQEWPSLPLATRRRLLERMAEVAEVDVANDFTMAFRVALGDEDEIVRAAAVDGLWEDEDPKLADVLLTMLAQDPSSDVREAAAEGLEHFAMLAECDELPSSTGTRVRQGLLAAVRDPSEPPVVRQRALGSVACMSGDDVNQQIEAAYGSEEEGALAAALYAMGQSNDERWSPQVLDQLKSRDPAVRYEAVRAAGVLEIEDAAEPLLRMIVDPDPQVKQAVLEALGLVGGAQAELVLEELAQTGDDPTRRAAASALSELRFRMDPLAAMPLALDDEDGLGHPDEDWHEEPDEDDEV